MLWFNNFVLNLILVLAIYFIVLFYMSLFFEISDNGQFMALIMTNMIITNPLLQFVILQYIHTFINIAILKICVNLFQERI